MLEIGRVVMKTAGREAGKYAVVVENKQDGFVMITGPKTITGVKKRRCNISHVEPTQNVLSIGEKADDAAVEKEWKSSGLIEKLEIKVPVKKEFKKEPKQEQPKKAKK